jgi:hypothetical protein
MKKYSNKVLIIALVVLIGIFALSKVFRSPKLESNVRKELVTIDTAKITEVRLQPAKALGQEIKLIKSGKKWKLLSDSKEAKVEAGTVESMLGVLMNLQAQRMVTRKKEKWDTFEVGENSTRVSVYADGKKLTDFRVGKTGFSQSQGQGISGAYTYIRMTDEVEVYSTEGFIGSYFNRSFNDWRDKTFLRVNKEDVARIEFVYPDSSFVLEKRDSLWFADSHVANTSKVDGYFNRIRFKNVNEFEEGFASAGDPLFKMNIVKADGALETAQAWIKAEEDWVLTSSFQDGVYFTSKTTGAIKDVFIGKNQLID